MTGPVEVLVVDDDFMVAHVHVGFVERTDGFKAVGAAHSGQDAIRLAAELTPDLILLDIYLPDLSGLEVLRRLREDAAEIDVLMVSAAREPQTVEQAWRDGAVDYLLKPFTYADLAARLERYAVARVSLPAQGAPSGVGQADIDRLFGARASSSTPPKGLSQETAVLVQQALQASADTMSAAECAHAVGISRVSARRYLEHLVGVGQAEVRLRYGGTGRPERRYSWSS